MYDSVRAQAGRRQCDIRQRVLCILCRLHLIHGELHCCTAKDTFVDDFDWKWGFEQRLVPYSFRDIHVLSQVHFIQVRCFPKIIHRLLCISLSDVYLLELVSIIWVRA